MRGIGAVGILIAAALTWADRAAGQGGEKPAALVNGEPITMAEVKAVLDARPSPVPLTEMQQRELRKAALEMLIDDVLMRQFLAKAGGAIPAGAVDKELADLKVVLKKQGKTFEQFLREAKQTESQFRADVQARLQWKKFLVVRYTDAEIKSYYEANKPYFDKVQVRASHILVKLPATGGDMAKWVARSKLETIQGEMAAGKLEFAEAAKKYSDCPSKDKGGDIGLFPYKFVVVEPFAKAAFGLKVGEMSGIVATEFGFHIIKVTERTKGEPSTLESARDGIREVMSQEQDLYSRIVAEQRKAAKIEVMLP